MSDQGFSELVWENGQLLTRVFPKRSQNSPSCNVNYYSLHHHHSSNSRSKNGRPKFVTSDSIVDDDDDPQKTSSVPTVCNNNSSEHKLFKDSQVVPVDETTPAADDSSQAHHQFSLQQHHQVSSPLNKRPRLESSSNLFPMDVLPKSIKTSQDYYRDLVPGSRKNKKTLNFSLFLRSPAVQTSPTPRGFSSGSDEKLQNKPGRPLAPAAAAYYGSKIVKGSQNQLDSSSMDIYAELLLPPAANNNKSVPCVQSEAVNGQTSSLPPAANTEKGKLDAGKCKEPPVPSSSCCSLGASNNNTYIAFKRRHEDTEESARPSDDHNEEKPERKDVPARGRRSNHKRKRTPEVHNQSEKRRRDKINKKMRALQELIPNCSKVDKASMLDDAIEYLKTLEFQVQMMSMGSGICMPPMMLPTGLMQQMNAPQMSHFSPMGMRMQMGVGCNPPQFLTAVPGIYAETRIPGPGFPGHQPPLPMSMLHASLGAMHKTVPMAGISRSDAAAPMDSALPTNLKD